MRVIVFYLICFFLIWRILDYHKLADNTVPTTLSRLTPPIDYFTEFVDRHDHYDRFELLNCINYHKAVAYFFPFEKADAYGMLGFCYDRLGQEPQAVAAYKQAIAINSYYFWPYYDLGVISYNHAQYAQAEDYFHQAVDQDLVKSMIFLSKSKVYNDVRLMKQGEPYDFFQGLKQGHQQAIILLMDSLYKTGAYDQLLRTALYGIKVGLDMDGIFYYYAGVAAFHLKFNNQAIGFLQLAIQDDPNNTDAFFYMGLCLKVANRGDMAQLFISKASLLHKQGIDVIEPYLRPQVRFF